MTPLQVGREGSLLRMVLARPEKRNALDPPLLDALRQTVAQASIDPSVRVLLLEAEGDVFCAGGDVDVMRDSAGDWRAFASRLRSGLNRLVLALHACPKPIVASVPQDAYGAGAVLAFQCDQTIVAHESRFAMSFRHVGLVPDTGGTWLLPRVVGMQRAKHLVWTGTPFSGQEAAAWGLALEAVPREEVRTRALETCRILAAGPAGAMALAKRALEANASDGLAGALDREARLQAQAALGQEHAEGRDAFFARRKPVFET